MSFIDPLEKYTQTIRTRNDKVSAVSDFMNKTPKLRSSIYRGQKKNKFFTGRTPKAL